jgi:tetratricopeptide (TPR) repeat protein
MIRSRALLVVALLVAARDVNAQRAAADNALKRGLPPMAVRPVCPTPARAPVPTAAQRRQASDLAQRGQQSAILGDRTAARDQLRQAAALDPTDPDLAYQLARAYEGSGANAEALLEYCRFLAIAPAAPEASEARERVQALAPVARAPVETPAINAFRAGITAFERGLMAAADAAFTRAIAAEPQWPEPYFDRALARIARGEKPLAVRDLEQYLRLRPEADDRAAVVARIASLRGTDMLSPSTALTRGLILPGGGQFYTGRRVLGVATLAGAAGSVLWALKTDPVTRTVQQTAIDPFGNPYTFSTTRTEVGRPYLARGLGVTAALVAVTAVESFVYARRIRAGTSRVSAVVLPAGRSVALRASATW